MVTDFSNTSPVVSIVNLGERVDYHLWCGEEHSLVVEHPSIAYARGVVTELVLATCEHDLAARVTDSQNVEVPTICCQALELIVSIVH